MDSSKATAEVYLTSLLSKNLRITTSDTRLFVGEFKCTDRDRNIILSRTYEYRLPSISSLSPVNIGFVEGTYDAAAYDEEGKRPDEKLRSNMSSRYLGLVVVPGEYIRKIELEEFASQVKEGEGKDVRQALSQDFTDAETG